MNTKLYQETYPEIAALIDAKIASLLKESEALLKGEQSYAYVVGTLKAEIKWALGTGNIDILKDAFDIPRDEKNTELRGDKNAN